MSARVEKVRPCIHVTLLADADPGLYRWVQIGAEEEGVPCRQTREPGATLTEAAYAAAESSRFNVGVAVSGAGVALHEVHMPAEKPVLIFSFDNEEALLLCRLMGCNAARMVIRKPFRFVEDVVAIPGGSPAPPPRPSARRDPIPKEAGALDRDHIKAVVKAVIQQLSERGFR